MTGMLITKFGHCCLLIEAQGLRIMTDPGAYSTLQNAANGVDYVFITHEHPDHLHLESLKTVLKRSPGAEVVTNRSVGKILDVADISYTLLEHDSAADFRGLKVEGHGEKHAVIYKEYGQVQNTGYLFAEKLFYPGDAFFNPQKRASILALPVSGPWMKVSEAIEYAKALKPRVAFPVHDGMLKFSGPNHALPAQFLPEAGIQFVPLSSGESREF